MDVLLPALLWREVCLPDVNIVRLVVEFKSIEIVISSLHKLSGCNKYSDFEMEKFNPRYCFYFR